MRPLKIMAKGPTMGLLGLRGLSVSNDCIQCGWSAKKKCYFALKEEVLLTVITGVRKKKTPHLYRLHICLLIYLWILPSIADQKVGGSHIHRHSHIPILLCFCKNFIFPFQGIPQKRILSFVELYCATWFQALLVWVWVSVWRLLKSVKQDQDGGGLTQRTQYCRH